MKKTLALLVLGMLVIGYSAPVFADTSAENLRQKLPKFENGQRPQINGENGQKGEFDGRRPKYKPDSQPGGKMMPKEWDSSSNKEFNGKQPPQMKDGLKYGLKDGLKNGLKNGQLNGDKKPGNKN